MTTASQPSPATDTSPLEPAKIAELFAFPRRFFARDHNLDRKPELYLVIWLAGMAKFLDRIDLKLTQRSIESASRSDLLVTLASSWKSLWISMLLFGLISGGLGWLIGGWWYGVRLHLAGAPNGYEREARLTWAYTTFVTSMPIVVLTAINTVRYDSYVEANEAAGISALLMMALLFWSVYVSYTAATTRFKLNPGQAKLWFLILPLVIYLVFLVLFGALGAFVGPEASPSVPA